jgi:glutathione-regulated potassium-efflux system ancillary protein KefC
MGAAVLAVPLARLAGLGSIIGYLAAGIAIGPFGLALLTAALMQNVGLSMALGAFLAGVLLAGSEYRRELETDLEPFKGLLLGLFFIAVGMGIDFAAVAEHPLLVAAIVAGFLALKALVLWAMARLMKLPLPERAVLVILLAQGGEFGFVVLQQAGGGSAIGAEAASLLVAAIAISMLATPLLLVAADRWWAAHLDRHGGAGKAARIS